jgi:hypothetical protein
MGEGVAILSQFLFDISWHGYVNVFGSIIPIKSNTTVEGASPVLGELTLASFHTIY